jgi:hypothetical protein
VIAAPHRGTLMGNRGCLHDATGRIRRPFVGTRWIICVLQFKGRRRPLMVPGHYTELFFLDEATALAAGHRPCMECQRSRYLLFRDHWRGPDVAARPPSVPELDRALHAERLEAGGGRRTYVEQLSRLPDGVIVADGERSHLVRAGALRAWAPGGYELDAQDLAPTAEVRVLTPRSIVQAIARGYPVEVHPSASG